MDYVLNKYVIFQFIILSVISVSLAARLDNVYLPPNARSSAGASAGLQAPGASRPFGAAPSQGAPTHAASHIAAGAQNQAEILRQESEINENGFHYAYETSDGTKAEQQGNKSNVLLYLLKKIPGYICWWKTKMKSEPFGAN